MEAAATAGYVLVDGAMLRTVRWDVRRGAFQTPVLAESISCLWIYYDEASASCLDGGLGAIKAGSMRLAMRGGQKGDDSSRDDSPGELSLGNAKGPQSSPSRSAVMCSQ